MKMNPLRFLTLSLGTAASLALSACVTTTVTEPDGTVRTTKSFATVQQIQAAGALVKTLKSPLIIPSK